MYTLDSDSPFLSLLVNKQPSFYFLYLFDYIRYFIHTKSCNVCASETDLFDPRILVPAPEGVRNLTYLHKATAPSRIHSTPPGTAPHEGQPVTVRASLPTKGGLRICFTDLPLAWLKLPLRLSGMLIAAEDHPVYQHTVSRNVGATVPCRVCRSFKCLGVILYLPLWPVDRECGKFPLLPAY